MNLSRKEYSLQIVSKIVKCVNVNPNVALHSDETNKAKELLKTVPLNERRVNEQQDKLDQLIREEKTLTSRLSETKTKFSEAKSALNAASTRSFF